MMSWKGLLPRSMRWQLLALLVILPGSAFLGQLLVHAAWQRSYGEVQVEANAEVAWVYAAELLAIMLLGLIAIVLYRSISADLRVLEEHAAAIKEGDLDHRVQTCGVREFESVGKALNDMAVHLRSAQAAAREAGALLEQRVEERTTALMATMEALGAERRRFNEVLDILPAYVALLTPDYHVPFANRYFRERFGDSHGRRCFEYLFERNEPCERCDTYTALKTNAPHQWEWTGPDGRNYDVHDFPFADADGATLILEMGIDVTERKQAEAELEIHRRHLEELVRERTGQMESLSRFPTENPNPVLRISSDQTLLYANNAGEPMRVQWNCQVGDKVPGEIQEQVRRALETGAVTEYDVTAGDRVYSMAFAPIRAAGYVNIYGRDITERKRAEDALQRVHDELEQRVQERTDELRRASMYARSLIEASLDPLVTIDLDGKITDVNRATELATEVSRSELIGSDFALYFTEPADAERGYQRALCEGQVTDYPLTMRRRSGGTVEVLYNATVYRNEAGEVQGVFAAARDVTQRNRVEEELRKSTRLLAEAQRIAHLGSWNWDVATDELIWSDEVFRIFGFAPQEFEPNYPRFLEMVHPDDRPLVEESVRLALDNTKPYSVDHRIVLPDNEVRIVHEEGEVTFGEGQVPVCMIGTVLDITEVVRAREEAKIHYQQLVQADKMASLGILVSGVAHEINNPNHAIMTNVAALSSVWESSQAILEQFYRDFGDFALGGYEYAENRDRFPSMFADALDCSRRIQVIVDELRDFARQNPSDRMAPVNVNAAVESAVILVSNMVRKSTERFFVDYATKLPPVRGDRQRIEQVVINLIQNACQSLSNRDNGIYVRTSFCSEAKEVFIEVLDEGKGIPEEDLKHLGDPFFTTKRTAGGMGLGLWISFGIAHDHGGKLTFDSKLERGTRAVFSLPVMEQADFPGQAWTMKG